MKKNGAIILVLLILSAVVVGALLSGVASKVSWLNWLSFGRQFGFGMDSPAMLDIGILKLTFGIAFKFDVATIICLLVALFTYKKFF